MFFSAGAVCAQTRERFSKQGFEAAGDTPQQFAAQIGAEFAKWTRVVRTVGITAD